MLQMLLKEPIIMPFSMFKNKDSPDYKARLERKMCLARDTPEPIFDLSECNLKAVPSGVFTLCKVLRKEALFLQENALTSLLDGGAWKDLSFLKILDVHDNLLTKLPDSIGTLINLEVLNISDNKLTRLPASVGSLTNLQTLKAANNRLKDIPSSISKCKSLNVLDLRGNPLKKLPSDLPQMVENFYVDNGDFSATCDLAGVEATEDLQNCDSDDTFRPRHPRGSGSVSVGAVESEFFLIQEKLKLLQQQKESQKEERLAWEKSLLESNELAATSMSCGRSKLVRDIISMESRIDSELLRVQEQKDTERNLLVEQCLTEDLSINQAVHRLLKNTKRSQEQLARITELDDQIFWSNFHEDTKSLDAHKIIDAMNELAQEEILKAEKLRAYQTRRKQAVRHWMNEDTQMTSNLAALACEHRSQSEKLTEAIAQDERMQKAAVAAMMQTSDAKSWQLAQQVASIEQQLAELTKLELSRRKVTQEEHLVELAESRIALSELLIDVLAQQQSRREELVAALQKLDRSRGGADDEGYWLQQYNKLLHSASHQMVKAMRTVDERLQQELSSCQVLHYLPLLSTQLASSEMIAAIDEDALSKAGIEDIDDRKLILKAIRTYLKALAPSAPSEEVQASAPPLSPVDHVVPVFENECVICMSAKAEAVFLPCGHMCSCSECASLTQCPLCRSPILTVVHALMHGLQPLPTQ